MCNWKEPFRKMRTLRLRNSLLTGTPLGAMLLLLTPAGGQTDTKLPLGAFPITLRAGIGVGTTVYPSNVFEDRLQRIKDHTHAFRGNSILANWFVEAGYPASSRFSINVEFQDDHYECGDTGRVVDQSYNDMLVACRTGTQFVSLLGRYAYAIAEPNAKLWLELGPVYEMYRIQGAVLSDWRQDDFHGYAQGAGAQVVFGASVIHGAFSVGPYLSLVESQFFDGSVTRKSGDGIWYRLSTTSRKFSRSPHVFPTLGIEGAFQ